MSRRLPATLLLLLNVMACDVQDFYEDIYEELGKYGELESLNVCDNLADHMVGNVYVQFREEEQAAAALQALTGRFYAGRPIIVDFSPVTDFREATCRQYEENTCNRGGYCNFMHLKKISRELRRKLFGSYKRSSRSRTRSPTRSISPRRDSDRYHRDYDDFRSRGGRGYDRRYDREDGRSRSRKRDRSISPSDRRRGRSRSPGSRRNRSPVREGSAERRAKIEQWNREREGSAERRAKIEKWNRERETKQHPSDNGNGVSYGGGALPQHEPEKDY